MNTMWDLFICHASEDKSDFVDLLATELQRRGYAVWYDTFVLRLGERLPESISEGLSQARFGVVVLSPAFFQKTWPRRELDVLLQKDEEVPGRILPVWHSLSADEVREHAPLLATRVAIQSSKGVEAVANAIADVVGEAASRTLVVNDDESAVFSLDELVSEVGRQGTVLLRPCTYRGGALKLNEQQRIRIVGADPKLVRIEGYTSLSSFAAELSGISFVARDDSSPCLNVLSGRVQITNCTFSRGRDGLMVQNTHIGDPPPHCKVTLATIEDCIFTQNRYGVWCGIGGKAVVRGSRFIENKIALMNAGGLPPIERLNRTNDFERNAVADYAGRWDVTDGTVSEMFRWNPSNGVFSKARRRRVNLEDDGRRQTKTGKGRTTASNATS